MHKSLETVAPYMSAFAEQAIEESLNTILSIIDKPAHIAPSLPNLFSTALAATGAAHGMELLLKSAIASRDPLLIFYAKDLAKLVLGPDGAELKQLHGCRTVEFSKLPDLLENSAGYKIPDSDLVKFYEFVRLRNQIEHFGAPPTSSIKQTMDFIFSVVDPIMRSVWDSDALSLVRPYGVSACLKYLQEQGIHYEARAWLSSFDESAENAELEKLKQLRGEHLIAAEQAGILVSDNMIGIAAIIPLALNIKVGRQVVRATGERGELPGFSVPLCTIDGSRITHMGANWASMTYEQARSFIRTVRANGGDWCYSSKNLGREVLIPLTSFDELIASNGLKKYFCLGCGMADQLGHSHPDNLDSFKEVRDAMDRLEAAVRSTIA